MAAVVLPVGRSRPEPLNLSRSGVGFCASSAASPCSPARARAATAPAAAQEVLTSGSLSLCHAGDLSRPFVSSTFTRGPSTCLAQSPTPSSELVPGKSPEYMPWAEHAKRLSNAFQVTTPSSNTSANPTLLTSAFPQRSVVTLQSPVYMPLGEHAMRLARVFQDASPATSLASPSPISGRTSFCLPVSAVAAQQVAQSPVNAANWQLVGQRLGSVFQDPGLLRSPSASPALCSQAPPLMYSRGPCASAKF